MPDPSSLVVFTCVWPLLNGNEGQLILQRDFHPDIAEQDRQEEFIEKTAFCLIMQMR